MKYWKMETISSKLQTPIKEMNISKHVTDINAFKKDSIRHHIYDYFSKKE